MLIQPTLDTLNQLKLYGMAAALTEQLTQSAALSLPFEDRLGLLVEREVSYTETTGASRACCSLLSSKSALRSKSLTSARAAGWIALSSPVLLLATGFVAHTIY